MAHKGHIREAGQQNLCCTSALHTQDTICLLHSQPQQTMGVWLM